MTDDCYEIFALKYAERSTRTRGDSFISDADHASPHNMDYFIWAIRNEARTIVVDTGFDAAEAKRRGRAVIHEPAACLTDFGIPAEKVETVILTHLHYDHAGSLDAFPEAKFHVQASEVEYATGPCMCHPALNAPFTARHVCQLVENVYSGRVHFHRGDSQVAPGVEIHAIGGHTRGLQAVRVRTRQGWVVLASDASHYYENFMTGKLFPILVDAAAMLEGFGRIQALASSIEQVIPGHDPLVRELYPVVASTASGAEVVRLDVAPLKSLPRGGNAAAT